MNTYETEHIVDRHDDMSEQLVDNLQVRLRHNGMKPVDIETVGDYLLGIVDVIFSDEILRDDGIRKVIEDFASKYSETSVGYRAAMLLL